MLSIQHNRIVPAIFTNLMCHIKKMIWTCGHESLTPVPCSKARSNPKRPMCYEATEEPHSEEHAMRCVGCSTKSQEQPPYSNKSTLIQASRAAGNIVGEYMREVREDQGRVDESSVSHDRATSVGRSLMIFGARLIAEPGARSLGPQPKLRDISLLEENGLVDPEQVRTMPKDPNCGNPRNEARPAGDCPVQ